MCTNGVWSLSCSSPPNESNISSCLFTFVFGVYLYIYKYKIHSFSIYLDASIIKNVKEHQTIKGVDESSWIELMKFFEPNPTRNCFQLNRIQPGVLGVGLFNFFFFFFNILKTFLYTPYIII